MAASSGDEGGKSRPAAAARDQSNYSLVEAAQYGLLQRSVKYVYVCIHCMCALWCGTKKNTELCRLLVRG